MGRLLLISEAYAKESPPYGNDETKEEKIKINVEEFDFKSSTCNATDFVGLSKLARRSRLASETHAESPPYRNDEKEGEDKADQDEFDSESSIHIATDSVGLQKLVGRSLLASEIYADQMEAASLTVKTSENSVGPLFCSIVLHVVGKALLHPSIDEENHMIVDSCCCQDDCV